MFGLRRPVLLLPAGIMDRLTPPQLKAIMAHELCHIRRRYHVATAIHMGVETLFWFHPLVWWLGARLMEERERAGDEEVLLAGSEPQVYAEGILKICGLYLESPSPFVSGMTGANLRKRIEERWTVPWTKPKLERSDRRPRSLFPTRCRSIRNWICVPIRIVCPGRPWLGEALAFIVFALACRMELARERLLPRSDR